MRHARRLVLVALAGCSSVAAATEPPAATLELYRVKCASCHMADGSSPLEPLNFTDAKWTHGSRPQEVAKVIAEGVPGTAMLAFKAQLSPKEVADLAAYVRSFDKSLKAGKSGR
jgi:mono/diheme cytochrome c family protein